MSLRITRSILILVVALTFAGARPAFAGPPLLCHPYDIASARSLPWGAGGWMDTMPDYDVSRLTADTLALLTPSTPVVARMETLRRAAIYASRDRNVAAQLLGRLASRTRAADADHRPDPLAWLDAAYLTEAFRQIGHLGNSAQFRDSAAQMADLVKDIDGGSMIEKAVMLRPGDPGMEFAAALIAADKDRAVYLAHAKKARAGAASDELVARNINMVQ